MSSLMLLDELIIKRGVEESSRSGSAPPQCHFAGCPFSMAGVRQHVAGARKPVSGPA